MSSSIVDTIAENNFYLTSPALVVFLIFDSFSEKIFPWQYMTLYSALPTYIF